MLLLVLVSQGWTPVGGSLLPVGGLAEVPEQQAALPADGQDGGDGSLAAGRAVDAGRLHAGLVAALADARRAAASAGVELPVASGYRSAEKQLALLEQEIALRGSRQEALHWVFPPERSMHVRGLAVDVNHGPGADWLQRHGGNFGLCSTLEWEWWHFEWRERWQVEGRCPRPATTPAEAPGL